MTVHDALLSIEDSGQKVVSDSHLSCNQPSVHSGNVSAHAWKSAYEPAIVQYSQLFLTIGLEIFTAFFVQDISSAQLSA